MKRTMRGTPFKQGHDYYHQDGIGIPGVNVMLKGTTRGTVTDYEGTYHLNVSSQSNC